MGEYIKDILDIDSETKERILENVKNTEIPSQFEDYIRKYEDIGGERSHFLWKWGWNLLTTREPSFMLSTVPKDITKKVAQKKLLIYLYVCFSDDVADRNQSQELLECVTRIPNDDNPSYPEENKERAELTKQVFDEFETAIKDAPYWNDYKDILFFDINQTLNSFRWSYLLNNKPSLINYKENMINNVHNMMFYLFADIDLMYSENFDKKDLPYLREAVWYAQKMGRIGNWLSTWEREIENGDLTSGIISYAVSEGLVGIEDVKRAKEGSINGLIDKIDSDGVNEELSRRWVNYREELLGYKDKIDSVDIEQYTEGLDLVMKYHLASEGFK